MKRQLLSTSAFILCLALLGACKQVEPPPPPVPDELKSARAADSSYFYDLENFLARRDQLDDAVAIDSLLRTWRHPGGLTYRDSIDLRADALMMAMDGVTPGFVQLMREVDFDVVGTDWKEQPTGQAATSELVVVAFVRRKYNTLTPPDGYRSTADLRIEEVLKGELPTSAVESNQIKVRRLSGFDSRGRTVKSNREYGLTPGKTYLLFLSNALYDYRWQYPDMLAETTVLDTLGQQSALRTSTIDALEVKRTEFFVERYQGTRIEWFKDEQLAKIKSDIRRVHQIAVAAAETDSAAAPNAQSPQASIDDGGDDTPD